MKLFLLAIATGLFFAAVWNVGKPRFGLFLMAFSVTVMLSLICPD